MLLECAPEAGERRGKCFVNNNYYDIHVNSTG